MSVIPNNGVTVICLGSNVPDRFNRLQDATAQLQRWCRILSMSDYYEAPDDSGIGAPYVNVVLSCIPLIGMPQLADSLKRLERSFGRDASSKALGVMPLDVDIVIWKGEIVDSHEFSRPYFIHGYNNLIAIGRQRGIPGTTVSLRNSDGVRDDKS